MSKVRSDNYVVIQGWMVSELGLKGNELLIYAIIHGFSQGEDQVFKASLDYLCEWTNSSKESVRKCLNKLAERGLIIKAEDSFRGKSCVIYYTTMLHHEYNLVASEYNLVASRIQQSCPNNIEINKLNNIDTHIEAYTENESLRESLRGFAEMRELIKKKLTVRSLKAMLKRLDKLAETDDEKIAILNQSIMFDWQGVYPLHDDDYRPRPQTAGVHFSGEREEQTEAFFDPAEDIV